MFLSEMSLSVNLYNKLYRFVEIEVVCEDGEEKAAKKKITEVFEFLMDRIVIEPCETSYIKEFLNKRGSQCNDQPIGIFQKIVCLLL